MTPTTDQRAVPGSSAGDDPGKTGMTVANVCELWTLLGTWHIAALGSEAVAAGEDVETFINGLLAAEREACARLMDAQAEGWKAHQCWKHWDAASQGAAAIRARSSTAHRSDGAGDDSTGAQAE